MMPTHGMFCIIAICKGDWLHQSWGNAASLDHIHALLGGGRGPLTAQNLAPFSVQKFQGILMTPSFAPKDASSRPLRTYTCKKKIHKAIWFVFHW